MCPDRSVLNRNSQKKSIKLLRRAGAIGPPADNPTPLLAQAARRQINPLLEARP
jgi:hypothetical protein